MKAETAYNVIQALSGDEKNRLYRMLNHKVVDKKPKKKVLLTNEEAIEILLNRKAFRKKQ